MKEIRVINYIKILLVALTVLLLTSPLSGCWDSKDIDKKLIGTAIAFDYKDGEIWYFVEYANIKQQKNNQGAGAGAEFTYLKGRAKTLPEMRGNLDRQLDKPSYPNTVRVLLFTESFANKYLVEYLYRARADENYRKKIETVCTMEDLEKIFKTTHENDRSVGFVIEDTIDTLDHAGLSVSRTTLRLIENLSSKYTGILMFCIGLQNKEIAFTGYSVVDGDKLTGFIPAEESKGVAFLKADKPKFAYIVPYKDNNLTIEVELKKRKITSSYKMGEIIFNTRLNFDAKLMYGDKKTPYNFEDEATKEVTEILKETLLKEVYDAIERAQKELKCDYFQFDDEFRIRYPAEFENMDWHDEFLKSSINVEVNVDLSTTYMMDYGAVEVK